MVDDNPTHIEIISNYLKSWGCRHNTASSADEALTLLKQAVKDNDPFYIIIIDKIMPVIDGVELTRIIKKEFMLKDVLLVPLIPLGLNDDINISWMKETGCDVYLTKPIKRAKLLDCIVNGLTKISYQKKIRILLVEDNFLNKKIVSRLLHMHSMKIVNNGKDALDVLQKEEFDLMLMDMQVSEIDDLKIIKIIRDPKSEVINHDIIIIVMTKDSFLNKNNLEKRFKEGINGHLSKPIDPKKLIEIVELVKSKVL